MEGVEDDALSVTYEATVSTSIKLIETVVRIPYRSFVINYEEGRIFLYWQDENNDGSFCGREEDIP